MQVCPIVAYSPLSEQLTNISHNSDAALAIGGAALLDQLLYRLLVAGLIGEWQQVEKLIELCGRRKALAYCTGLISRAELDDLIIVARIRNHFAHDYPLPTFDGATIRNCTGNFRRYHEWEALDLDGKAIYVRAVHSLGQRLEGRLETVKRLERQ